MNIDNLRDVVRRHVQDDGTIVESALPDGVPIVGTLGEVTSLSPPRVELLSGRSAKVRAFMGPVPEVGQIVLMIRVNHWWLALTGMTVVGG